MGDLNCDEVVDFADFLILSSNFGKAVPASTGAPAMAAADLLFAGDEADDEWLI